MSDQELREIWPSIEPRDIRLYAPWATSRDEVIRIAYQPGVPPRILEAFVEEAIINAKRNPSQLNTRSIFEPNVRGEPMTLRPPFELPVLLDEQGRVVPPPPRPVMVSRQTIEAQFDWMKVATHELVTERHVLPQLDLFGQKLDRWTDRQTERVIGINPRRDPRVGMQLRQWNLINVNLIESSINGPIDGVHLRPLLSDLAQVVEEAHTQGLRVEVLAHQIAERFGVSDSRAAFIARDQTLKLNGQLMRTKQQNAGVTQYRWSTSRDERVRKTHQALEGTIQSWDVPPPGVGHPGEDYQCRCVAIPIIPGL